jgi:uncharacterized membrane protein YeaQ/YmgE (transglycosylase-associated protein family)
MTLGMFLMWVVVGLIAGRVAGSVMKEGSYGQTGDLILGLAGSVVASGLFLFLGVSPDAGWVVSVVVAFIGAAAVIFAQREFWSVPA